MAATTTPDPSEVRRKGRQRLIGAVVIVVLAVVFVPMILDPEPRKDRPDSSLPEKAIAIPPKEGAPALPAPTAPVPRPEASVLSPKGEPAKPTETKKAEAPKAEPKAAPDAKSEAKAAKPAAAAPAKPATPELKGFAVQVGAFRDEEKLKVAREKLTAAKIPHFTERLAAGDLTRLRAGPYSTREGAEKAVASIKAAGLEGKVVPLP